VPRSRNRFRTCDEEFDIAQFLDQFSQEWHRQLGPGYIDRPDRARTHKLHPKLSQQIGTPRHDANALANV